MVVFGLIQVSNMDEQIRLKNNMISQLDHSTNSLHVETLSLKKTLASVNEELMLKDKTVS